MQQYMIIGSYIGHCVKMYWIICIFQSCISLSRPLDSFVFFRFGSNEIPDFAIEPYGIIFHFILSSAPIDAEYNSDRFFDFLRINAKRYTHFACSFVQALKTVYELVKTLFPYFDFAVGCKVFLYITYILASVAVLPSRQAFSIEGGR